MEASHEDLAPLKSVDDVFVQSFNDFNEMLLIKYPIPVVVIVLYLLALRVGTSWMKDRPAFQFKTVLRIYDISQVFFNLIILYPYFENPTIVYMLLERLCKAKPDDFEVLRSGSQDYIRDSYFFATWFYLVVKMIDLLDTIFMVLMKNNTHITFLHVYHHASMVFFSWLTLYYAIGFHSLVPGTINSFVHLIMYSYYFLSTFGPSVQKYLWWKQHLTKLQIGQFLVIIAYLLLLYYKGCSISKTFIYIWASNVGLFLCLFINFYRETYIRKSTNTKTKSTNTKTKSKDNLKSR